MRDKVHGAIFTRGPKDLARTAFFIGGSDVTAGEKLLAEVQRHMLPAVRIARVGIARLQRRQHDGRRRRALGRAASRPGAGAGPDPGRHRAGWAARGPAAGAQGAEVRVWPRGSANAPPSRVMAVQAKTPGARLEPAAVAGPNDLAAALAGRTLVFAAGAAGVVLLPKAARLACPTLRVAVDLNAVPPLGIEGVEVGDKGKDHDGVFGYGALGVGDLKMKVHRAAIARLFESNDQVLDAEQVYALAQAF